MVIGDMPVPVLVPVPVPPGGGWPCGPCCIPLRTSIRPMIASCKLRSLLETHCFRHATMREATFRLRLAHLFGSLRISLMVENYFVGFGSTECRLERPYGLLKFPGNEEKTPWLPSSGSF